MTASQAGATKEEAWKNYCTVIDIFTRAGFVISASKSDRIDDVSQQKKLLGFTLDTVRMKCFAPESKLSRVLREVQDFASQRRPVPTLYISSIVGKMAALKPSHGSLPSLLARSTYISLMEAVDNRGWSSSTTISEASQWELLEFCRVAPEFNGCFFREEHASAAIQSVMANPATTTFASDASGIGAASYDLQRPSKHFFQFEFSPHEMELSSGHRELLALLKTLRRPDFHPTFCTIWYTDSMNLTAFVTKGSPKPAIQSDVVEVLRAAAAKNTQIRVLHLGREDPRIQVADELSRVFDSDDWSIDSSTFDIVSNLAPDPFSMDAFASPSNARHERFASLFAHRGAVAVDAFSFDWSNESLFLCPPIHKLIPTIRKISLSENCSGVLIFPHWTSQSFWPILFEDGRHLSFPFNLLRELDPVIATGEFYRGAMSGRNNYKFWAAVFDTASTSITLLRPSICAAKGCSACEF